MGFWVSWLRYALNGKWVFFGWFLVLWGVLSWSLLELTFPRSSYSPFMLPVFIAFGISIFVLVVMGGRLYSYLKKNELSKRGAYVFTVVFSALSLVFVLVSTPYAITSFNNKAVVQWYIDDLKSQGFTVEYFAQYTYNRGGVTNVQSYSQFTSIAKEYNCTWVGVYGGAPSFFFLFFPSYTEFLINQYGQYVFAISW